MRLPDGRALGYQIFGPAGAPMVIYCHGFPSSRLEAGLVEDLPLQVVAFDRPGYGLSDPHPQGTLQNRAGDVAALADHLGLDRFPVVGVSGGGPLASACARYLGPRVSALTLISAVPPPDTTGIADGLGWLMRLGRWGKLGMPPLALARRFVISPLFGETAVFGKTLPPLDAAVLTPAIRQAMLASMREGLRQGIDGAMADAGLYGRDWGFRLQDITVPTAVWHGTDDQLVDVGAAEAYAGIPGAVIHIADGHGHFSLMLGQTAMILDDLLARAALAIPTTHPSGARAVPG